MSEFIKAFMRMQNKEKLTQSEIGYFVGSVFYLGFTIQVLGDHQSSLLCSICDLIYNLLHGIKILF